MNIGPAFVANFQTSKLMQPGDGSFHHPTIHTQATTMLGPTSGQGGLDTPLTQLLSMRLRIVSPITIQTFGAFTWSTPFTCDVRNRLDQRQQLGHIMSMSPRQTFRQRDALAISQHMMLRAFFAAIGGIGAGLRPPKTARTEPESTEAREKSIWLVRRNCCSNTRWILSHTPAFCQSRNRRQQVIPLPHPISWGRYSQPMPVFKTNKIPVKTARSDRRLRPGYRKRRGFCGNKGWMISHNWSSNIGLAMSNLLVLKRLLMISVIGP